jgi:PadR family transcriptional regulator PadR
MPLVNGTLDVLVLKALSWTPMHAYEVARWLDARSGGQLDVEDGALMQALRRLEERSLLTAEWGMTDNGRRARYYRLTRQGRAHLRAESKRLTEYASALTGVLGARSARG